MWEEPILAQLEGIELDDATIAAVVASLGSGPRPVTLDKARIDRQIRDLALEHAAGRLEDDVYLERLHEFRDAKDNIERTRPPGPVKGAPHWRQRGELGIRLNTRRPNFCMESGLFR